MNPCSLEYAERDMYVGCGDGLIRRFLASASQDGSTNFTPTWATPPIALGRKVCIDRIVVYASQTSGGAWGFAKATDLGSYGTAVTYTPGTTPTARSITFTGNVGTGYIQQVRVTMPTNGVRSKLFKMRVFFKDTGGA